MLPLHLGLLTQYYKRNKYLFNSGVTINLTSLAQEFEKNPIVIIKFNIISVENVVAVRVCKIALYILSCTIDTYAIWSFKSMNFCISTQSI